MGRRVGAACSPDKVGSSRGRPRQGAGVAVRWGGRLHGGERRKASSVLPPTRAVEGTGKLIKIYVASYGLTIFTKCVNKSYNTYSSNNIKCTNYIYVFYPKSCHIIIFHAFCLQSI